jgi:putative peptidoglycan lipid II flippase
MNKSSSQSDLIETGSMFRSTGVVGLMTFLSRIMGLVRDIFFARLFGAFPIMDAFFVAFKIPNSFRRFFAEGAFSRAFIPVLSDYENNKEEHEIQNFIDRTSGTLGLILFCVCIVGVIFAPILILIFAPGFFDDQSDQIDRYNLSVSMLRFTFPYLLFISLTAFAGAILNTKKHFWATAFNPVILNIVLIIAAGFIAPKSSNPGLVLACAVFFAGFLQLLFLFPFLKQVRRLPKPKWGWQDSGVRRVIRLMIPSIIGSSASQFNLLFNTLIASFLTAGSISWIYYSDRLLEFPIGVFGVALSTVVLPSLSRKNAARNISQFKSTVEWGIKLVFLFSIPASIGLFFLSGPLIATIFLGGNFNIFDLLMTQYSLMAYSFGLVGLSLVLILSPVFYSREDTKTPLKYGLITMATNALLSLVFVLTLIRLNISFPHIGLAFAFSIASILNALLLFRRLRLEKLVVLDRKLILFISRIILASFAMTLFLINFNPDLPIWMDADMFDKLTSLLFLITVAVIIYILILFLLGLRMKDIRIQTDQ